MHAHSGGGRIIYPDGFASAVGFIPTSSSYTSGLMKDYFRKL
jgi:hypothetical protein